MAKSLARIIQRIGPLFVLSSLLLTACDNPSTRSNVKAPSGSQSILRRGNSADPESLDPVLVEDVQSFNVIFDLYEGLVVEETDGTLQPGVATHWEVSNEGRRYTFHLRSDALWSTGEPVTAANFVAGFRRAASPKSLSPSAFLLAPIKNFREIQAGELDVATLGVFAADSQTLIIELVSPTPYFPGILAMPLAMPQYGDGTPDPRQFHDPGSFVGNGAYVLQEWSVLDRIRLEKSPTFHDAANVAIDVIEYFPIDNPMTEFNMFRAGELDITAVVPTAQIAALRESRPKELRIAPALALYYIAFDLTEPPFDNPALRQALSMATDRRAIVNLLGRGEQPAYGLVPPGVAGHRPASYAWADKPDTERIAAAQALFRQATESLDQPLQLTLTYDTGDVHETIALAVTSMWRDSLGLDVQLQKKEWKLFLATRADRPAWQMMRFAWFGDYNDASTFSDIFRSDSPQNLPMYRSDDYDRLLDLASRTRSSEERTSLLHAAERQLLDDYPIIPLYFYVSKHLVSPAVKNFESNVLDRHPSRFLSKD